MRVRFAMMGSEEPKAEFSRRCVSALYVNCSCWVPDVLDDAGRRMRREARLSTMVSGVAVLLVRSIALRVNGEELFAAERARARGWG